jgi:hypothetical protein
MAIMYRQGDLLIIEANNVPEEAVKLNTLNILGSSVTGHVHKLTKNSSVVYSHTPTWDRRGNFYLIIKEPDKLVHEEHKSIDLPVGVYEVRRQREVNGYVAD